jgi:class 3 adenylate cyclase
VRGAAAAVGDRAWGELLDRHDEAVRGELPRVDGRELNRGEGILATFDNLSRAPACGRAIRDAAAGLGLVVGVGLHTGQVQVRGEASG